MTDDHGDAARSRNARSCSGETWRGADPTPPLRTRAANGSASGETPTGASIGPSWHRTSARPKEIGLAFLPGLTFEDADGAPASAIVRRYRFTDS